MKRLLLFTLVFALATLTSCKKCDPSNSSTGMIVENSIIRVVSGKSPGNQLIRSQSEFNQEIEMSLDGGITYEPVDFSKYSVFALATTASCSSGYNRDVSINQANKTATYSIEIVECSTCEGTTTIANWVLTTKIPSGYSPKFVFKTV